MPENASDQHQGPFVRPQASEGTITIRWWRLPEPYASGFDREFDWEYRPDPGIPDEFAERLLREVANRL
jgi:hypothetical protein